MSAKKGGDHDQCGACTVLLDGGSVPPCLALAVAHEGFGGCHSGGTAGRCGTAPGARAHGVPRVPVRVLHRDRSARRSAYSRRPRRPAQPCDRASHRPDKEIAPVLGLELEQIRVISPHVGGSFGSKYQAPAHHILVAVVARRALGGLVKFPLTRRQMFTQVGYRTPTIQRIRLGADHYGRITATARRGRTDREDCGVRRADGCVAPLDVPMPGIRGSRGGTRDVPGVRHGVRHGRTPTPPTTPPASVSGICLSLRAVSCADPGTWAGGSSCR
ncbi:molybdopterin cofactor-binding domain-containing protein [Streptomyces sp. NPDC057445]|uniref:molybdopterin cofactor-binding domain-containing protein n=1 Tax=Streptomyces sp. NPDC057445 TaxID=3346136 RepID=UPI00369CA647